MHDQRSNVAKPPTFGDRGSLQPQHLHWTSRRPDRKSLGQSLTVVSTLWNVEARDLADRVHASYRPEQILWKFQVSPRGGQRDPVRTGRQLDVLLQPAVLDRCVQ